ncbi:NAD(P)H-dependent FMN reductase [Pectobacterium araliae]|uniref:NAD(P)H-dependent FMN reductase n=1 Tax=Pectobacterium araliae TaxID=3073862 RepID=A0AAN0KAC6_9GAMM|nr:NAD(P)H-dependent FMN reductase [Pectobacterium sp. MAFF 302110]GKW20914.1 NAD(P)H-dependent FMN reductase [Pectobacterium carotovorum subsp. carotovorum]
MSSIKLLGIAGSLRKASTNRGLLRTAQSVLPAGVSLEIADLLDVPFYNADLTEIPESVQRIARQAQNADGFVFACTEYNYSVAPALKNILDWLSRLPDTNVLNDKPAALMGAGGGMGTSRAQYHLRQTCVFLNIHPLNRPEVFSNAYAGGFDEQGNLHDEKIVALITEQIKTLADVITQKK